MTGTDKFLKYNDIRTGWKSPKSIKKLWRYTPEIFKKPLRKLTERNLPQDITMDDFYFEDKISSKHLTLISFSENK